MATEAREVSARHHTGFTAEGLRAKALHPALVIIWSGTWGEAGFLNTAIPSASLCIPNHFLFHGVLAVLLGKPATPQGVPCMSILHSQNLDTTECVSQIFVLYSVLWPIKVLSDEGSQDDGKGLSSALPGPTCWLYPDWHREGKAGAPRLCKQVKLLQRTMAFETKHNGKNVHHGHRAVRWGGGSCPHAERVLPLQN